MPSPSTSSSSNNFCFFSVSEMAKAVKLDKLHSMPNPDRREKIGRFLTSFTKFVVDSAVNVSSKGVDEGKNVYKIVQERLKNQPTCLSLNDKPKSKDIESVEEMQAKMEEILEGMSNVKHLNTTSTKRVEGSKPQKKIPNEDSKGADLLKTNEKRVFIRSRL